HTFTTLLNAGGKGRVVECGEVEGRIFFGGDVKGQEKEAADDDDENSSGTDEDEGGGGAPIPSSNNIGEQKLNTQDEADPRRKGMQKARNREMVRQAARRGVAFGFRVSGGGDREERRDVEAVQGGRVVESSFAKGEWGIRWK
ncbi:MAG: hypothetical protein Q9222_001498, partial [Ikaeria aurantiellina]